MAIKNFLLELAIFLKKTNHQVVITLRQAAERGHFDFGWLNTYHSFSFGDYHNTQWMGFQALRVINEDRVRPGEGFPTHSHRDMEIITYVLEGVVEHQDSMGNKEQIRAGELQRMTAGTGVTHSEYNPSPTELLHLLQIWIFPEQKGLKPGYEQKKFPKEAMDNQLRLVASPDGTNGSLKIHQDTRLYVSCLAPRQKFDHHLADKRHGWVQMIKGVLHLNNFVLKAGDGAAISNEKKITLQADSPTHFLLFDLA